MNALPVVLLGVAVGLSVVGCPAQRAIDPLDGDWCGNHKPSNVLYIDIDYAGNGKPSANPSECAVHRGTKIIWRGPGGDMSSFQIEFRGQPPGPGEFSSRPEGARQKAKIERVTGDKGKYKYGIRHGIEFTDPEIIIK